MKSGPKKKKNTEIISKPVPDGSETANFNRLF